MPSLTDLILARDPFQQAPDDRNDPAVIEMRFRAMAQHYAAHNPNLVAWVERGSNPLPKCYR